LPKAASPPAEEQAREEAAGAKPVEPKASGEQARTGEQVKTDEQANIGETLSNNLTAVGGRVGSAAMQKTGNTDRLARSSKAYETVTKTQIKSSL